MKRAVYIGNFDPVTLGHMDIIHRAVRLAEDKLIVGVSNAPRREFLFPLKERIRLLELATADIPNVEIQVCSAGSVYFAKANHADIMVRGVRNIADFEYECQMAQTNRKIEPGIETVFFSTDLKYSFLSSGAVREFMSFQRDVSCFVPGSVADQISNFVQ